MVPLERCLVGCFGHFNPQNYIIFSFALRAGESTSRSLPHPPLGVEHSCNVTSFLVNMYFSSRRYTYLAMCCIKFSRRLIPGVHAFYECVHAPLPAPSENCVWSQKPSTRSIIFQGKQPYYGGYSQGGSQLQRGATP